MKANHGLKELEIPLHNFFVCLVETLGTAHAPQRNLHPVICTFVRNHEPNKLCT